MFSFAELHRRDFQDSSDLLTIGCKDSRVPMRHLGLSAGVSHVAMFPGEHDGAKLRVYELLCDDSAMPGGDDVGSTRLFVLGRMANVDQCVEWEEVEEGLVEEDCHTRAGVIASYTVKQFSICWSESVGGRKLGSIFKSAGI